jgi:hypothetical protein
VLGETGKLRDYVEAKFDRIECQLSDQKAYNAANNATLGCISNQIAQLYGLTKLVVPNTSVCPGWGDVTITPAAAPAAGASVIQSWGWDDPSPQTCIFAGKTISTV